MERVVSITVSTQHVVNYIYQRILGEAKARGRRINIYIDGNSIRIPYEEGIEEVVWNVIKSSPFVAFTSIDLKK